LRNTVPKNRVPMVRHHHRKLPHHLSEKYRVIG
jgi:hypothetical protein